MDKYNYLINETIKEYELRPQFIILGWDIFRYIFGEKSTGAGTYNGIICIEDRKTKGRIEVM